MFEFLMLSCIALIIFSQLLPKETRENNRSRSKADPDASTKTKQLMTAIQPMHSKKPCRRVFDRAA